MQVEVLAALLEGLFGVEDSGVLSSTSAVPLPTDDVQTTCSPCLLYTSDAADE